RIPGAGAPRALRHSRPPGRGRRDAGAGAGDRPTARGRRTRHGEGPGPCRGPRQGGRREAREGRRRGRPARRHDPGHDHQRTHGPEGARGPRRRNRHGELRRDRRGPRVLPHQALTLGFRLYGELAQARAAAGILEKLYAAFYGVGASLAEINPLATTPDGRVVALDAKIVIDDNELDRRPDIAALRDASAEAPSEARAREAGLTFIKLDGAVGCCVNG